jgi:hypothetical protein
VKLELAYVTGDPRKLAFLEVNARYFKHEDFKRLVANIRRDGVLSSVPLVWRDPGQDDYREVLSGNHRVKAAIEAGLEEIGWLETCQPLNRQQRVALQLAHNAIEGDDDPATLKRLYEELYDVDWREYSGLDDQVLGLLGDQGAGGLSEANLSYATVLLTFLPTELEEAKAAFAEARKQGSADEYLLAAMDQYQATLDALASVHGAHKVGNVATALALILAIFEAHIGDLRDGWYNPETREPKHDGRIPVETLLGARNIPAGQAAVIAAAIDRVIGNGDADNPGRALELLCADALGGPDAS